MKIPRRSSRRALALLWLLCATIGLVTTAAARHVPSPPNPPQAPAAASAVNGGGSASAAGASAAWDSDEDADGATGEEPGRHRWHRSSVVSFGHDSKLAAGEHADVVVSIFGSSSSAGSVSQDLVSILGNSSATGPVGGAAVAVLGNVFVDSKVDGDVVAVLGKVELGPHAEVGGEVVSVGGSLSRDPAAIVHGNVQDVSFGEEWPGIEWLQSWIGNCLVKGRLLAFAPHLTWAWILALVSLGFYALTALLLRSGLERCVDVLEEAPGQSLLAALLTALATPILIVLLCITVIGIAAVPFVVIGLFIAGMFGRTVVLAWIGTRILRRGPAGVRPSSLLAVLVGGLIVIALYTVPILGFIVFQLVGFVGMGAVVYTAILAMRASRAARQQSPAAAGGAAPAATPPDPVNAAAAAGPAGVETGLGTDGVAGPAVAPGAAHAYPHAGFWIRMFALGVDAVLVSAIIGIVWHLHDPPLLPLAIYGAVMWKIKGATIGDIVCNLHVVRLDGRPVDWATAIVRALGCYLSLFIAGLGFIWIAIDRDRQAWHDKIAGTVVVRVPKGVSLI